MLIRPALVALLASLALPAAADISLRFDEGAPKDRFMIVYTGDCPLGPTDVVVDLSGSAGALIFDVTGRGAGVEVFQPVDVIMGADDIAEISDVRDGDQSVTIRFDRIMPMQHTAFTVDVDDTLGGREITVDGSEISGATARVLQAGATPLEGAFGTDARARVAVPGCLS